MILCILDKKRYQKAGLIYVCITIFCGVFSFIYETFSHGVASNAMIYLFLYPLIGGLLPLLLLWGCNCKYPERLEFNLYQSGIACLTIGSCLKGVFEIYGTSSAYIIIYQVVGLAFVIGALLIYLGREI